MRVTGIILMTLGSLMVLVNLLTFITAPTPKPDTSVSEYKVAYYIGYFSILIVGAVLVYVGYRLRKKAKLKKQKATLLSNLLSENESSVK